MSSTPAARRLAVLAVLAACGLAGCMSGPVGAHRAALPNLELLRQTGIRSAAVGEFRPGPGLKAAADKSVSVRGHVLSSPAEGSFARYLRDSLIAELAATGLHDPQAASVLSGELLENTLDGGGASTGTSTLGARFVVTRSGSVVFDKSLRAEHSWQSHFVGAVAIPEAINQYTEMYTRLLAQLYSDAAFREVWLERN